MSRSYESNGPDVKIRGTAAHIAEKYGSLARDALSSGDNVMAENYLQHAEHYNRIIAAAAAAQSSRNEENASANSGRGPQPNVGFNAGDDADGNGDRKADSDGGDADQKQPDSPKTADDSQDQPAVAEAAESRPRSEGRGRRRTRREPGVEKANGNGSHGGEDEGAKQAVGGEAKSEENKRDISSDASMLPDSILGAGAPSPEASAED